MKAVYTPRASVGAPRTNPCVQKGERTETRPRIGSDLADVMTKRLSSVTLALSSARSLVNGSAATLIQEALDELDLLAVDIRGEVIDLPDPLLLHEVIDTLEYERLTRLSRQERTILELISQAKTNREIANELCLAERTIKNYVSRLLQKMGFARRTEAAVYVALLSKRLHDTSP